ncbi:MAG: hypothetical protein GC186_02905 [Rhodobacteraceae bacterium]|nr:hypothetical protein [Paracoccaceae bacterium]
MMLIEQAPVPQAVLPVAEFKDHLRLGSGFADDGQQDALAESYLRAALAAIEGRIGKALIERVFWLELSQWREAGEQPLPLAPVQAVASVTLVDAEGAEVAVEAARWRLVKDLQRPRIVSVGVLLPQVPQDGAVEIVFAAGFGPAWSDVPADLRQAVLLLAAQYYELRHESGAGAMPFGVMALIERWRTVRVLGGGVA